MADLHEIVAFANSLLGVGAFRDYCPNGLQVEGRREVKHLVTGVSACRALLEAAVHAGADAVLVHHGYFWKGETPEITGIKRARIKCLLDAELSLLAYHLPLDAHPEIGNNARLGQRLGFRVEGAFGGDGGPAIGLYGSLPEPLTPRDLGRHLEERLEREPLHIDGGPLRVRRVAWVSGAAQSYIEQAHALGVDAFISGEISEPTVHFAREAGIHYYAAGHHATERYGVQALGLELAEKFGLKHQFIDVQNPV